MRATSAGCLYTLLLACTGVAQDGGPVFRVLYQFAGGADAANRQASLVIGTGGVLCGTTHGGGNAT